MSWRAAGGVFTRGVGETVSPRLLRLLTRLDELVNWERAWRADTGLRQRHMRVDVKPVRMLLEALGNPHDAFRAVHIAGTKGKGTLAAMLTAYLLTQPGLRVGTYTSPHVERIQERIRLQGECIEDNALADALEAALDAASPFLQGTAPQAERPTWFDIMTTAGFVAMKEAGVTYAVVECGMGGAKDSTNVLGANVCLLTSVALEHAEIIGPTLADIAREKAGIAWRPGCVLISGVHQPELQQVIRETVERQSPAAPRAVIFVEGSSWEARNEKMAEYALTVLSQQCHWERYEQPQWSKLAPAIRRMLPGRMEWFTLQHRGRLVSVLVDGAHVPETVHELPQQALIVLAMGRDKRVEPFTEALLRFAPKAIFCTRVSDDAGYMPVDELYRRVTRVVRARAVEAATPQVFATAAPGEALMRAMNVAANLPAPEHPSLVCIGSLHLAGLVRPTLFYEWSARPVCCQRTGETATATRQSDERAAA